MARRSDKKIREEKIEEARNKLTPGEMLFVQYYLGMHSEGRGWNNGVVAYALAYDRESDLEKVYDPELKKKVFSPGYFTCKSGAGELLLKPKIRAYKNLLLDDLYKPEHIKRRYSELGWSNKNPAVALSATDRVAKIAGILKDDPIKVDIPQLQELTTGIRSILDRKDVKK